MGKNDSTKTRVIPVFSALMNRDPTGVDWLPSLLALPIRRRAVTCSARPPIIDNSIRFGTDETSLDPPRSLLRWMLQNPSKLAKPRGEPKSELTKVKRNALLAGDRAVQAEALSQLDKGAPQQVWWVLEGRSRPDVYFETTDAIVVIEGKRTEREATTATSWLPNRHQMLRHLDCAWDRRNGKRVYGFFIVEATMAERGVPRKWRDATENTVAAATLDVSLPHRSMEQRRAIADSFLGTTTWQIVCDALSLQLGLEGRTETVDAGSPTTAKRR